MPANRVEREAFTMRANLPALRSVHISNAGQCGCDDMRASSNVGDH